jgi:putative membrane protein
MSRKINDYLGIGIKGIAMGAADVIPGVSGGTIAFITGIYEELLSSIKNLPSALPLIFKKDKGLKAFWEQANLNFLLALGTGIGISILSLARLMTYLLEHQAILTWSFFFGLILASTWYVMREVELKRATNWIAFIIGALIAYGITAVAPTQTTDAYWFIFVSGAIAICAMILPGISGSFILLLLGKYLFMMEAIKGMKVGIIVVFMSGAAIGLVLFSNVLSWLLKKYHQVTVAVLGGFMIGSLNKVWPWKEVTSTYTDRHGVIRTLTEANVLPNQFRSITETDPQLLSAIIAAVIGFSLVFAIEFFAQRLKRHS